jgi:hypothetical protein
MCAQAQGIQLKFCAHLQPLGIYSRFKKKKFSRISVFGQQRLSQTGNDFIILILDSMYYLWFTVYFLLSLNSLKVCMCLVLAEKSHWKNTGVIIQEQPVYGISPKLFMLGYYVLSQSA